MREACNEVETESKLSTIESESLYDSPLARDRFVSRDKSWILVFPRCICIPERECRGPNPATSLGIAFRRNVRSVKTKPDVTLAE